jgi:hypothetical protein
MKTLGVIFLRAATVAVASFIAAGYRAEAANINWTNTASGSWNTAANWNPNNVPGAADTAIITNAGVTVTLDISPTVGGVILGTNGPGTVTLSLAGQTLVLNGPLTVNPSGSFTVDSGAVVGNANAGLSGTIGWTGGLLEGALTLASGSTLNLTTGNNHDIPNCTFTNNGTVVWNTGTIRGGGTTIIYNNGLWNAKDDSNWNNDYGGSGTVFNNYGTFRKSGSTGGNTTFVGGAVFNNTGKLDSQISYIVLSGGGNFTGGTATNLAGFVYLNGGAFNINGTVTSTNVQLAGASLTGTNVISGGFNWISGLWNSTVDTIAANSTLLITTGNTHDLAGCTVTNNGTVAWTTSSIRGGGNPGTTIYNNGLWNAQDDSNWNNDYGGLGTVFNNYGTFRKSGGASEFANATIFQGGALFNQLAGAIDVQNGTSGLQLQFLGGGNLTGGYVTTNTQGLLDFVGGSYNLNGAVTGTNTWLNGGNLVGTNVINGALTWLAGNWNNTVDTIAANSTLLITTGNSHDLAGCTVTNNGTVAWSTGEIRGGGNPGTTIYNNGLWTAQDDSTWDNAYGGLGTVFNNYGTFRKSGGASEFANATFFQNGAIFNQLAGVIDVQNSTNGLQLQFLGGGNFTGGYVTTNTQGLLDFVGGSYILNGAVTGTNTWLNGGTLVGTNVINGALTWLNGSWNNTVVTVSGNSVVNINTASGNHLMGSCILNNFGTVNWSGDQLYCGAGTVVYNYGLWNAQDNQILNNYYGAAGTVFDNLGTFRKSGGTNTSYTLIGGSVTFTNTGVVDVQTGSLVLQGIGNFNGGYITTNNSGLTWLSSGNFNLNGTITGTNVIDNAGSLVGTNVINGALTWQAGNWNGAVVTVSTNSLLVINTASGNHLIGGVILTNFGTVNWSGDLLYGGNGTVFYNYGLWNAQDDQILNNYYGGAGTVFNNFGTFRKSGGANATFTLIGNPVTFNNTGVIDVQSGTNGLNLVLQGLENFTGGFTTTNSGGLTWLSSGSFTINGTVTSTNVIDNPAVPVGMNVIKGGLTWQAGSWNGAVVTVSTNSLLNINTASGSHTIGTCIITNYGTVNWSSDLLYGGAGTAIYNYGLWNAQDDQILNNYYGGAGTTYYNFGTFRKTGTSGGSSQIQGGVAFNNTGTLDSQLGNISLQGAYSLTNGTLNTGINSLTNNGTISLTGAAALTGTVGANLNNGYIPIGGNSFTNIYFDSSAGIFTNATLPFADAWSTNYFPTYFVLNVLNARPIIVAPTTNRFEVNELTQLTVTNTATDADIPSQSLVYSLVVGTNGMVVNPATGILTWTPQQTNSPSTNIFSVAVTDNGNPALSATNSYTVIVKEVNIPPSLPTISTQTVNELTLLTVNNTATNANIHSTITGYALVSPLAGMAISAGGIFTWTPAQIQSPSTNTITTIVTNSNPYDLINPQLKATNTFAVIVKEVNVAPSLPVIAIQSVNELSLLSVTNSATNANIHSTITGYALVSPLTGMGITAGGIFTWTPAQNQSPSTNTVTTVVTNGNPYDLVNPKLTATNSFTVIVKEVNQAPLLPVVGNQTATLLQLFTFNNSATEPNIHSTNAGYALISPPAGAAISSSGVITWTPTPNQTLTTNTVTTVVTNGNPYDAVNPGLTATNSFKVVVLPNLLSTNVTLTANGTSLNLKWPADHTGWELQSQTNTLAHGLGTNWVSVTGSAATNQVVVPINRTNSAMFFRLTYP